MTDIVKRLHQVQGDNADAREAADKIEKLRNDYSILKSDYDALREELAALQASSGYEASIAQVEIERLRDHMRALADTSVDRDTAGIFKGLWHGSEKECDELRAELERLRVALQQIVAEAESDDGLTAWDGAEIARRALEPKP